MSEFIGSRISLISRSDIRYVGILHDINSENHTVALEQVVSHGTEGRRGDPTKEIAGSDNVYEYIVFRGGDVKDLRIEETAQKPKPQQQVPDDPAILGSSVRPPSYPTQGQQPGQFQQPMPPYYYPPPPQSQGRFGPSPYQAPMYGAYPPPPGQQPGMGQVPPGVPQQQQQQQPTVPQQQQQQPQPQQPQQQQVQPPQQQQTAQNRPPPIGPAAGRQQQFQQQQQQQPIPRGVTQTQQQLQGPATQDSQGQGQPPQQSTQAPAPENFASASNEAAKTPTPKTAETRAPNAQTPNKAPTGPKAHGGIVPALPLPGVSRTPRSPAPTPATQTNNAPSSGETSVQAALNDTSSAVQDLANKVNELALRAAAPVTTTSNAHPTAPANSNSAGAGDFRNNSRQPGMGGFVANRGHRGNRGGLNNQPPHRVEVPTTDYDFESANAKFNKQDLVKEVIASTDEPVQSPATNGTNGNVEDGDDVVIPPLGDGFYNRGKSFFDNISCENKERAEAKEGERPRGGAVWRGEEQKKNLETFGQGSVDGGFGHYGRGGWGRGRSRGRGFGRGRGGYSSGYSRGGYRGSSQQGNPVAGGAN